MANKGRKGGIFSQMSREELLEFCRSLFHESGIESLSYPALKKHKSLYPNLYRVGLPQKELISELGFEDEYKKYCESLPVKRAGGKITYRWTWERCVEEAREVKKRHSYLPPGGWFQANGQGSLVQAVYSLGRTWEELREALGDFDGSSFVESRSGIRWRSHPEASLSNFLFARGIEHKRGEKYPDDYANHSTAKYAYYDLHFRSSSGDWINVEIWGDKPHGHEEERYREKRGHKEAYHANRSDFLGIHFNECFSDEALARILQPYIGVVEPFRFEKATDKHIESSHWSNSDELLESCRALAESMPDGKFPTEEWLRKRGKWASRAGEPLNTMSVYIKLWLGGVRKVRELLGQAYQSTEVWNRESAIAAYKAFYEEHGMTADQYRYQFKAGSESASRDLSKRAANIAAAVMKYASGSAVVNDLLGISIDRARRWTKESIIAGYREVAEKWGVSPSQLLGDYRALKVELDPEYAAKLQRLVGATSSQFPGGSREVYAAISFKPPSRPRKKRVKTSNTSLQARRP